MCVSEDTNYRNILVIITDGYIYHSQSVNRVENRTSYLTKKYLRTEGFRNNAKWDDKFIEGDYGLLDVNQEFETLEVLVLEVNSSISHKNDEYVIKSYLTKWFDNAKVNGYEIYNTDLPENTRIRVSNFFK